MHEVDKMHATGKGGEGVCTRKGSEKEKEKVEKTSKAPCKLTGSSTKSQRRRCENAIAIRQERSAPEVVPCERQPRPQRG